MNDQIEDSVELKNLDEPKIVGFESQPLRSNSATDAKKYGLTAVGIAFVIFLLIPTKPGTGRPTKDQENEQATPAAHTTPYRTVEEELEAAREQGDQQRE